MAAADDMIRLQEHQKTMQPQNDDQQQPLDVPQTATFAPKVTPCRLNSELKSAMVDTAYVNSYPSIMASTSLPVPFTTTPPVQPSESSYNRICGVTGHYPGLAKNERIFSDSRLNPIRSRKLRELEEEQQRQQQEGTLSVSKFGSGIPISVSPTSTSSSRNEEYKQPPRIKHVTFNVYQAIEVGSRRDDNDSIESTGYDLGEAMDTGFNEMMIRSQSLVPHDESDTESSTLPSTSESGLAVPSTSTRVTFTWLPALGECSDGFGSGYEENGPITRCNPTSNWVTIEKTNLSSPNVSIKTTLLPTMTKDFNVLTTASASTSTINNERQVKDEGERILTMSTSSSCFVSDSTVSTRAVDEMRRVYKGASMNNRPADSAQVATTDTPAIRITDALLPRGRNEEHYTTIALEDHTVEPTSICKSESMSGTLKVSISGKYQCLQEPFSEYSAFSSDVMDSQSLSVSRCRRQDHLQQLIDLSKAPAERSHKFYWTPEDSDLSFDGVQLNKFYQPDKVVELDVSCPSTSQTPKLMEVRGPVSEHQGGISSTFINTSCCSVPPSTLSTGQHEPENDVPFRRRIEVSTTNGAFDILAFVDAYRLLSDERVRVVDRGPSQENRLLKQSLIMDCPTPPSDEEMSRPSNQTNNIQIDRAQQVRRESRSQSMRATELEAKLLQVERTRVEDVMRSMSQIEQDHPRLQDSCLPESEDKDDLESDLAPTLGQEIHARPSTSTTPVTPSLPVPETEWNHIRIPQEGIKVTCDNCQRRFTITVSDPLVLERHQDQACSTAIQRQLQRWYYRAECYLGNRITGREAMITKREQRYKLEMRKLNDEMDRSMARLVALHDEYEAFLKSLSADGLEDDVDQWIATLGDVCGRLTEGFRICTGLPALLVWNGEATSGGSSHVESSKDDDEEQLVDVFFDAIEFI
ncbi:hypothetical protein BGZ65_007437 [Modicella reniformis]|uniref:Uncharacterized protein n=1 Tax=Modicella reniformis TaxID=1440133 RepID=A0A9P6MBR1_9FUNG|nr:hypothetical protein BGZ65_007437 [Modicella reniformis]